MKPSPTTPAAPKPFRKTKVLRNGFGEVTRGLLPASRMGSGGMMVTSCKTDDAAAPDTDDDMTGCGGAGDAD